MGVIIRVLEEWEWGEDCVFLMLVEELVLKWFGLSDSGYGGLDLSFLG